MNSQGLRILHISTVDKNGGAARMASNLHESYRRRGLRSWMVVGQKKTDDAAVFRIPNQEVLPTWSRALLGASRGFQCVGNRVPGMTTSSGLLAILADPVRYLDIYRGREDFHFPGSRRILDLTPETPDIVHCHNLHGGYFDLRVLPWLSQQVSVVITLHDAWLLSGHCAHSFNCERWRTGCGQCPDLTIFPPIRRDSTEYNWRRKRDIYAKCRLYVATASKWLMQKVEQSMLASLVIDARIIPYAIDLSVFQPGDKQTARAALGLPQDAAILLFAAQGARSNPFKDYATMESALARVVAQNEGKKFLFVCLGEEHHERRLGKAVIRFVAYQKDLRKLAQYYQAADVYVHAARAEAWGLTITEALACGTPVVATAVGGIPEQIEDGVTGFLTPPSDAEAMAIHVQQLLADEPLHSRFSINAAQTARQRFDMEHHADTYLAWYNEIVQRWQDEHKA